MDGINIFSTILIALLNLLVLASFGWLIYKKRTKFMRRNKLQSYILPSLFIASSIIAINYSTIKYSGLFVQIAASDQEKLIVMESPYDLEKTVNYLQAAVDGSNFRFIYKSSINYGIVRPGMKKVKGIAVYFCNFGLLSRTMNKDKRVGMFIPFQITAIEHDGKVDVIAFNPRQLAESLIGKTEIDGSLTEVYNSYVEIINNSVI